MKIYLVRHGESEGNVNKLYSGTTDVVLTEKGKEQAKNMAKLFENINIEKIYASPLSRAYNTALEISKVKNMPIETSDLLKEMYFGIFENLTWKEIESRYPEEAKKCIEQEIRYKYVDGECFDDVLGRFEKFFINYNDNSVVVAHGMFFRAVLFYLGIIGYDNIWDYSMKNCDVLCIENGQASFIK